MVTHGSEVADMWLLHESSVSDVWFRCGWLVVQMRMACGSSQAVPRSRDAGSLLAFRWHKVGTWLTHGSCMAFVCFRGDWSRVHAWVAGGSGVAEMRLRHV